MKAHNSHLYMSVTKVLVFLDCAGWEGRDFLEDLVKSLQTDEELKKLLATLSKRISAFEDHLWDLALSKELAKEEVALCVNLALTATRPVIGNYFNGCAGGSRGEPRDQNPWRWRSSLLYSGRAGETPSQGARTTVCVSSLHSKVVNPVGYT